MEPEPLLIRCPATGVAIRCGLAIDRESYKTATLTNNRTRCPLCGDLHLWNKEDTFFDDPTRN